MAEYIEREKIWPALNAACAPYNRATQKAIDSIPAADVRPVVRAHWTDRRTIEHDGEWYCSNCGNEVTICMCGKDKTQAYPFCPNCGAMMDES